MVLLHHPPTRTSVVELQLAETLFHEAAVTLLTECAAHPASAAGAHALPFHLRTCPLVAEACAIFDGASPAAIFPSVTAESAISAVATEDFEASVPSPATEEASEESWESTEAKLETILFHSAESICEPEEAVPID